MALYEFTAKTGDTRYHLEYGTTTVNTTTGFAFSNTAVNGALYHAIQVDVLTPETSTIAFSCALQGTIDRGTPANWIDLVGTTITASGTGTSFMAFSSQAWPLQRVRGNISLVNSSCSSTVNLKIFGVK